MWASHFVGNGNKLSISSWLATEVQVCRNVGRPNPPLPNLVYFIFYNFFRFTYKFQWFCKFQLLHWKNRIKFYQNIYIHFFFVQKRFEVFVSNTPWHSSPPPPDTSCNSPPRKAFRGSRSAGSPPRQWRRPGDRNIRNIIRNIRNIIQAFVVAKARDFHPGNGGGLGVGTLGMSSTST